MAEIETIFFASQAEWEAWLEKEHEKVDGVWVKIAKKDSGISTVNYPEVLDTALCFGWIDGQRKALDETYFLQKFTPRRKKSMWSQVNVEKVSKLIEAGKMREAGFREIERAKADGRWDAAYQPVSKATIPDDLQAAFDANPEAYEFYKTLSSQNRFAILFRLQGAKRPETRQKRLQQFIEMLNEKKTIY